MRRALSCAARRDPNEGANFTNEKGQFLPLEDGTPGLLTRLDDDECVDSGQHNAPAATSSYV
jgi:hypothetical protein